MQILPIPKVDQPKGDQDYCPISILPALSKIFERLVLQQVNLFICDQALFIDTMPGFRKGHSTVTTLLGIMDDIIRAMRRGEVTLMVLADYSKAFDTVNFKSVVLKMHSMGFSKKFLHCTLNYLMEHQQFVKIDDKSSNILVSKFGIPQGSILGPLFFNIYVGDLQSSIQCPSYLYADDTTLISHSKPQELNDSVSKMNCIVAHLSSYSAYSHLALNSSKTKWMLLSTQQMSQVHSLQDYATDIRCNGVSLERVTKYKLLRVTFDQHMTWNEHITQLISSCHSALSIIRKLQNIAPYHTRKQLAETLILSKIDYCNSLYSTIPEYQMKCFQRVQNCCASFVLKWFAKIDDGKELGWLPIGK